MTVPSEPLERTKIIPGLQGLSGKLLILTIVFVMLAEILIWAPSISRFREAELTRHLEQGHLAALAILSASDAMVSEDLEDQLLFHAEARGVMLKGEEVRIMLLLGRMPPEPDIVVDLDRTSPVSWMMGAFQTLFRDDNRIIRIIGRSPKDMGTQVEVLVEEAPLRAKMLDFSTRILQLSLVISIFTASLVYLTLHRFVVRPVRDMTKAMITFREAPEDDTRVIRPGTRGDEIGQARQELAAMQCKVQDAITQQKRLAMLGAAVAKINHDLRNSLATAVLAMEKIKTIDDPDVKDATPRLYRAIDRAVSLCSQTLNYISDEKPHIDPSWFHLSEVIAEVQTSLRDHDAGNDRLQVINEVPFAMDVEADRSQIYRAIFNLTLNAAQAGANKIVISSGRDNGVVTIRISDNGPGLPQKVKDKMFKPFVGSARKGGVGLGLVIVEDVMKAHGGTVALEETTTAGTTFALKLPLMRPGSKPPVIDEDDEPANS